MSQSRIGYIDQNARSNWMRLRTLVTVRWVAITGQILALAVGQELYGLSLPLGPCAAVIGLSTIANIFADLIFPDNRRLSEAETVFTLLFDTLQLSLLLAFTGGLNNPFALLILAPVTIAATVLPTRSTLLLASCAVAMTTTVALVHLPLRAVLNGDLVGQPNAGVDMTFDFGQLIAHAAKTRPLCAGTIIGSGTVSNLDRSNGSCCLAEVRMLETIAEGKPSTEFMRFGDRIQIAMLDAKGQDIFGEIDQQVVKLGL